MAFSCGVEPLDTYLKQRATQEAKKQVAVTYVLCAGDSPAIIGYYSLSSAAVETTQLPEAITGRLPRYQALPALLIGRLAVDLRYHGQGHGELLLVDALKRCLKVSEQVAALAVLVEAKDERATTFYQRYGFRPFADRPFSLFLPLEEIKNLG